MFTVVKPRLPWLIHSFIWVSLWNPNIFSLPLALSFSIEIPALNYLQLQKMASSIAYTQIDDKDLDDAALWAVIDSATASHSSTKCKSLAIKYNNSTSPSPISKPLPPTKFQRISRDSPSASIESKATGDGEVEHEPWSFRPPRKVARVCSSETREISPLALVKNGQRTPSATAFYSSPESHLSPEIGRLRVQAISPYTEVSPGHSDRADEKEITMHGFSGKFPSVSLFREYQNTAMAVTIPIYLLVCLIQYWSLLDTFGQLPMWC